MDDPRARFRIVLHPSRILVLTLGFAHAGAAACVLSLDLGGCAKSLMIAFLCLSACCDLRFRAGVDGRRRIREIVFRPNDEWTIVAGAGRIVDGRPGPGQFVHPLAVCFSLEQPDGRKLPVLILRDMCDGDTFRDLRVWLRSRNSGGGNSAASGGSALDFRMGNGSRS